MGLIVQTLNINGRIYAIDFNRKEKDFQSILKTILMLLEKT